MMERGSEEKKNLQKGEMEVRGLIYNIACRVISLGVNSSNHLYKFKVLRRHDNSSLKPYWTDIPM